MSNIQMHQVAATDDEVYQLLDYGSDRAALMTSLTAAGPAHPTGGGRHASPLEAVVR
jgi:hypothetical protein